LEQLFFEFDGFGQKASMTDPDMGAGSYGYDLAGNLARQTDARNQRSCYYYDALNRLKDKTYSTGTAACPADPGSYTVSYSYDAGTNGKGQRTGMANPSGSTAWEYDVRGRMTRETKVINGAGGGTCVTQWTAYDAMDRVRSMVYPDSKGVTFDYTAQGPIKAVFGSLTYYVGETLYNALGQATDRYLGSTAGVIRQKYSYPASANFRLTALQSGVSPTYTTLQTLSYSDCQSWTRPTHTAKHHDPPICEGAHSRAEEFATTDHLWYSHAQQISTRRHV
jgi:YD repeat-containing protein